jgi:ferritin-like metal-binding protein YciE
MAELTAGDAKLVQYLNEAYGTEKRLETSLEAHIAMTAKASYKKRLREHLTETKRHAREVQRRIKQLGGTAETISLPGPDRVEEAAQAVLGGAQKAVALAQGPLHALRGTGEDEKQLKNAKTEYASEAEEIATYTAIATLAEALGDKETQSLARAILREEVRMSTFLEREIPRLAKAVAKAEVPASQRRTSTPAGKTRASRPRAAGKTASRGSASASAAGSKGGAGRTKAKAGSTKAKAAAGRTKAKAAAGRTKAKAGAGRAKAAATRTKAGGGRTKAKARSGRA